MAHGPYRLDPEPIGIGGYALVYLGVHKDTGARVAVKKPRSGDGVGVARFVREIEVQTQLDHPNVMPILDYSIEEGWLAMPLASRNLTQAVERDHAVTPFQLTQVIKDVVRGLDYAHRREFVHRDVNPNNFLEIPDPHRWVVGDWGLVRQPPGASSPRLTRRDKPLGTEGFIAPEALTDPHGADAKCDVYSVGRVVHFAVTEVWPRESFPLPSPGWLWGDFVRACTADRETRTPTMASALHLVTQVETRIRELRQVPRAADGLVCPRCDLPITGARCDNCGRVWD